MASSLIGILTARMDHPRPFLGYAVAVSRIRRREPAWRGWHGALMSMTLLGATLAASSIVGGVLIGDGGGARFYQSFNGLIAGQWPLAFPPAASTPTPAIAADQPH